MDPMETIKQGYFQECEELLLAMEEGLLAMEGGDSDPETINAVFRAVHSIKGGGGAFCFDDLVSFAHSFETVMDRVREGDLEANEEVMQVLLRAGDMLSDHVAAARSNSKLAPGHDEDSYTELKALAGQSAEPGEDDLADSFSELGFAQVALDDADDAAAPAEPAVPAAEVAIAAEVPAPTPDAAAPSSGWHVRFVPHAELYAKANEPALLLRELSTLGPIEAVADLSKLPSLAAIDPEQAYIAWTITLRSDASREQVEEVFEFAAFDCDLTVVPLGEDVPAMPTEDVTAAVPEPESESEASSRAEEAPQPAPISAPAAEPAVMAAAVAMPFVEDESPAAPAQDTPIAETQSKPEPYIASLAPIAADDNKPEVKKAPAANEHVVKPTIRVDLDKIDRLGNLAGELVITQAMLAQRLMEVRGQSPLLANNLAEFEHLLRELQEGVMSIRTQPVKSVFQRMPRLVRELAAQTGKKVRLVVKGEATEVDKTVIERLGDPLTHMIRNAIDHGLENAEDRMAAGKDPEGTVVLSAEHRGGRIVIEVIDDGRGINRARVREKALEKGLIRPEANLTDDEIDNLIFLPGFSTAGQVSNISGRGVGMDVVKRSVIDLGGRITLNSNPGKGSKFSLTLPLTLAVLDGMVVAVGDQTFVLPLSHIIESLQPRAEDIHPYGLKRSLLKVRDTFVPLVKIGELLDVGSAQDDPVKGVVILVESEGTGRLALAVDQILGQRQVVIKSFEGNYRHIEGVGAATILGDGRVALIIDVDGIVTRCRCHLGDISSSETKATGTGP